ncbi:hypothetical protein B0T22DRAFT_167729 [Podospora appendiculata]|uniref:Uncharacterized protein n=1 Tax=Podospora appendiculata TaxID=314037 RepID=A0AAE0XB09_9PEZI|nr:hypothetical protein B0T22DRAFT_167729 [Podospora appendiculata]
MTRPVHGAEGGDCFGPTFVIRGGEDLGSRPERDGVQAKVGKVRWSVVCVYSLDSPTTTRPLGMGSTSANSETFGKWWDSLTRILPCGRPVQLSASAVLPGPIVTSFFSVDGAWHPGMPSLILHYEGQIYDQPARNSGSTPRRCTTVQPDWQLVINYLGHRGPLSELPSFPPPSPLDWTGRGNYTTDCPHACLPLCIPARQLTVLG